MMAFQTRVVRSESEEMEAVEGQVVGDIVFTVLVGGGKRVD